MDEINSFQSADAGSPASAKFGAALVEGLTGNLVMIGTVQAPNPIYHRTALKNFPVFKTWSYEYYRTYPYRATQWFLDDAS